MHWSQCAAPTLTTRLLLRCTGALLLFAAVNAGRRAASRGATRPLACCREAAALQVRPAQADCTTLDMAALLLLPANGLLLRWMVWLPRCSMRVNGALQAAGPQGRPHAWPVMAQFTSCFAN